MQTWILGRLTTLICSLQVTCLFNLGINKGSTDRTVLWKENRLTFLIGGWLEALPPPVRGCSAGGSWQSSAAMCRALPNSTAHCCSGAVGLGGTNHHTFLFTAWLFRNIQIILSSKKYTWVSPGHLGGALIAVLGECCHLHGFFFEASEETLWHSSQVISCKLCSSSCEYSVWKLSPWCPPRSDSPGYGDLIVKKLD